MTLTDARKLRDEIRAAGLHCIVPLGHGPDGYFARIFTDTGPVDFPGLAPWRLWKSERAKRVRESERRPARLEHGRPRSPLELMIDRACGLA